MTPLEQHFDAYVENDLPEQAGVELSAWLEESGANLDQFVRESYLHWQLVDVAGQRRLHDDVMAVTPGVAAGQLVAAKTRAHAAVTRRPARPRAHRLFAFAAAAAIAIAGLWATVALRPHAVAQLSKTSADAQWATATNAPQAGALLHSGETLKLARGRIAATLVSGARLLVDGPAEVRVDGESRVWLASGRLGVEVPVQATGLVVECSIARFVDVGTDFTIELDPATGCQLYVFKGMVELTPNGDHDHPVNVSLGTAVNYDVTTGKIESLPYDLAKRLEL